SPASAATGTLAAAPPGTPGRSATPSWPDGGPRGRGTTTGRPSLSTARSAGWSGRRCGRDDTPPAAYPKRRPCFAHRFTRLMTKCCLANRLGPEVFTLLAVVVHQEDAAGYRGPVGYF